MNQPLLRVEGLRTELGVKGRRFQVVDGLDFSIRPGETFALLGESGCGKSMTALSLMRLLPPNGRIGAGNIWLRDTELLSLPETEMRQVRGGRLAMIFQEPMTSLNPVLRVETQIAEAVRVHQGLTGSALGDRVVELLTAVGIPEPRQRARDYPHQLSGGMKQRVMIAMALAGRPELLVADEPTTALDVTIQAQVLGLLADLQRDSGMAILLITHDLGVVAENADQVAVMYAGHIVEQAECREFFHDARHPYSRKLFAALPGQENRDRRLAIIAGTVPPLDRHFIGCRFAERCDLVMDRCREEEPAWSTYGESGRVRCWRAAERQGEVIPGEREATGPRVPGSEPPLLQVRGLKVHFPVRRGLFKRVVGQVRAVDGVDLAIPEGRTLALVGESGCGKTTVGQAILRLIPPTDGEIQFAGQDFLALKGSALRRQRAGLQIIFQDPAGAMNPRMLVRDIVAEGMIVQGMERQRAAREARVIELLGQVGLPPESASRYPHEFSGGQRQRICIARALAVNPRLIVCDEPTSALDVSVQAQVLNLLRRLQQELALSYLFITHNLAVVSYLAHEVAVMYLGRIVERGRVEEVLSDPRHPYTKALLAAVPEVNPEQSRQKLRLQGDLPSPIEPPLGCHFHPRCQRAEGLCRSAYPGVQEISPTHRVNCFFAQGRGTASSP